MAFANLLVLGLATFALGKDLLLGSMPVSDPMESLCMVWTVVEQPIYINTCFSSSTVATLNGFTTTVPNPTRIDITITSSQTLNPRTLTLNIADIQYTTLTTDIYTTVCPSPTTFTYGTRTYTVTDATTITITATYSPPSSQKNLPSLSSTPSLLPSTTAPFISISTRGMCGAGMDLTCQGSGFGNCCGSDNTCGHDAAHCGTGCQSGYGYCTTTAIVSGSTPVSIGNATLASVPAPAVNNFGGANYSFGFTGDTDCSLACAERNPAINFTNQLAFYEVSSAIDTPTSGYCDSFGYIYQVHSGLCITANKAQGAYPDYEEQH